MSKMNKYRVVTAGIMMLAGTLQASVINVDFQAGGAGSTYSVDYSGQGVVSDTGNDTWNIVAPNTGAGGDPESGGWFSGADGISGQALVDSTGAASGMSLSTADGVAISWNPANGTYADFADDAKGLMGDYLQMDSSGFARSVFVEGLTVGQEYELYLYGSGPFGRDTDFAVRCDVDMNKSYSTDQWIGSAATTGAGGSHNLTEGADFVKFSFTPDTGKDVLWIEYKGVDADPYASFNGLQLAAIPEPASIGLVGLAGTLFFVFRRRLAM